VGGGRRRTSGVRKDTSIDELTTVELSLGRLIGKGGFGLKGGWGEWGGREEISGILGAVEQVSKGFGNRVRFQKTILGYGRWPSGGRKRNKGEGAIKERLFE